MRDRDLYANLLGIEAPWHVRDIETRLEAGELAICISLDDVRARAVARGLARRESQPLENIGIDETSFQKRHE